MKYIIAFVLLGLVTYAGVFLLSSGIKQSVENKRSPIMMTSVPWQQYTKGMAVSVKIDRQHGKMRFTNTVRRKVFDIEFGDPIVQHYYVIPAGKVLLPPEQYYMLICVTDEADIKALDALYSETLNPIGSVEPLECRGVLAEMNPPFVEELMIFLMENAQLIKDEELVEILGDPSLVMPTYINGYNHICQYVFYVQNNTGSEGPLIITGAALTVIGAGVIALLAIKKHRENSGY